MTDSGGPFVLRNPARKASNVLWLFLIAVSVFLVFTWQDGDRAEAAVAGVVFLVTAILESQRLKFRVQGPPELDRLT